MPQGKWRRPILLHGKTIKVSSELGNLYITINEDNSGEVKEVFVHLGKAGTHINSLVEAIGRLISVALQYGVPLSTIILQLEGIKSGVGVRQEGGGVVLSVPDGIAYALKVYLQSTSEKKNSSINAPTTASEPPPPPPSSSASNHPPEPSATSMGMDICPQCGDGKLVHAGGCEMCYQCGYSRCL